MNKKESLVKNLRKSQMEAAAAEKEARRQKKELQMKLEKILEDLDKVAGGSDEKKTTENWFGNWVKCDKGIVFVNGVLVREMGEKEWEV